MFLLIMARNVVARAVFFYDDKDDGSTWVTRCWTYVHQPHFAMVRVDAIQLWRSCSLDWTYACTNEPLGEDRCTGWIITYTCTSEPLGEDRYLGEGSRRIRNSPKMSRRNWRFLGVSRRMLLKSSRRSGYLVYRNERNSSRLITHLLLWDKFP